jgi:sugar transferase (PEP-CTERM/EpsH1 system associated)
MRVLFLSQRVPYPPTKGDKLRAYHHLKAIASKHDVHLFTLADDPEDLAHERVLRSVCTEVTISRINPRLARLLSLRVLGSGKPLTIPYFYSANLAAKVTAALQTGSYDRVFVYCSSMAQYVAGAQVPVLLDLVDVDSDKWQQYADHSGFPLSTIYRREAACLRDYERQICQRMSRVIVTTEREAKLVHHICDRHRVEVIHNGVDADYFQICDRQPTPQRSIVFTGDMSYFPNQQAVAWFTYNVMPLIRRSLPGVRFTIVGRNPDKAVQQLATVPGIEVTGFVPDVRPYLKRAQVSIAPMFIAAGVQNKILEAMACEIPVVAMPLALQGLSAGTAALVESANTAEQFADKCLSFLLNDELTRLRGFASRRQVIADYSWNRSAERLLEHLEAPLAASRIH